MGNLGVRDEFCRFVILSFDLVKKSWEMNEMEASVPLLLVLSAPSIGVFDR